MGISVLFREPARLTQLTEKSRLFWLTNGSLKHYDRCENNSSKLLNEIKLTMSHNFFTNALICYEKKNAIKHLHLNYNFLMYRNNNITKQIQSESEQHNRTHIKEK